MTAIAEYRLHLKYPDGKMVPVWLRICRPKELPTGNWECTVELEGHLRGHLIVDGLHRFPSMAGNSWQAQVFAQRFLYELLRAEVRGQSAVLFSESGQHPIHFDELFPLEREWNRPSSE